MTLWAFLFQAVGPLAIKVLAALGISVLTITGVSEALQGLQAYVQSTWGGMPAVMVQLCGLAGLHTAVGLVLGAYNARLALWLATSATRWALRGG